MRKPWALKEYKEKRSELINGKTCAWCDEKENLVIHHVNPPKIGLTAYIIVERKFIENYFANGKNKDEYNKILDKANTWCEEHAKLFERCPKCGKCTIYERKTIKPKYRCTNCGYIGNKIIHDKQIPSNITSFRIEFSKIHNEEIKKAYQNYKKKARKDYKDLENQDILILCKRCHYAYHKGMVLCKECGKKYHKGGYDMCWDCFVKTPKGKEILERKNKHKVKVKR